MSEDDIVIEVYDEGEDWKEYLAKKCGNEISRLRLNYRFDPTFIIDYYDVVKWSDTLAERIHTNPEEVTRRLRGVIPDVFRMKTGKELDGTSLEIRFVGLKEREVGVRDIRSSHIRKLISVRGIVRSVSEIRPEMVVGAFRCLGCGMVAYIDQDGTKLRYPTGCTRCDARKFEPILPLAQFKDSQRVSIQEEPEGLDGGEQPKQIVCRMYNGLSGQVSPGTRCAINGILKPDQKGKDVVFDIYLDVMGIEFSSNELRGVVISEDDETAIRELAHNGDIISRLVASFANGIYGYDEIKLAILMQLVGGVTKPKPDGSRLRGDIHVLLLGDPGVAKSEMMRVASKVSPRGVISSGKSSTSAGLTCTAVKDELGDGRWVLEAGALVLADGGFIGVDELDKMSKEDRSALHEAMEQQCYDGETEVLTKSGWKLFKDVLPTDEIATLSKDGVLEYQIPTMFVDVPYNGDMYRIKSRQVDLLVTPNHNMYVNVNRRANEWHGFDLIPVYQLPQTRMRFKKNAGWVGERVDTHVIPSVVKYSNHMRYEVTNDPIEIDMDLWLEFLGYFLSEGNVGKHWKTDVPYRVNISQKKPESTETIRRCLSKLPFRFKYIDGNFVINSKQLATHLQVFGKSADMHIPDYVKGLPPEQLWVLINAMVLGDGCVNKKTNHITYITSSKHLKDGLMELLLKCGISGNSYLVAEAGSITTTPRGGTAVVSNDIYEVSFIQDSQNEPNINTNSRNHISVEKYDGMVYCVEVPNHVMYVRRNGIPVWCGNTISVSKAGISTVLHTRCALLGAANPKLGRFSPFEPVLEQVDMPPSLLSRFDLIFPMIDTPGKERDSLISTHIMNQHRGVAVEKEVPIIDQDFLRKYITYSRDNISPILPEPLGKKLSEYYVKVREMSAGGVVTITARQLQALVRMSEASAKLRLSPIVEEEDVDRSIGLMEMYMRSVAYDENTKTFDTDLIATKISSKQRSKIRIVLDVIRELTLEDGSANIQKVFSCCVGKGMGSEDVDKTLEKLKNERLVFEPRSGYVREV